MAGHNFVTPGNAFEVTRLSVEIGLLALALTPVIVSGGIDLSVGSLMGLSAVVLRHAVARRRAADRRGDRADAAARRRWRGAERAARSRGCKIPAADRDARLVLALPRAGRGPDAAASRTSPDFPERSSSWARATSAARSRRSCPSSSRRRSAFWVLLHRTTIGRALFAIGFSPEGARYAGHPGRRGGSALVYVLSGLAASLAAVIYVAHLGQAKADAGTGYELLAITAVVLGGTSIFGGRGTILGTLLGLFAIAVLQNGLRLADLPAELAGVLTGVLLVATIIDRPALAAARAAHVQPSRRSRIRREELAGGRDLRRDPGGALIVAGSNWFLVNSLRDAGTACAVTSRLPAARERRHRDADAKPSSR